MLAARNRCFGFAAWAQAAAAALLGAAELIVYNSYTHQRTYGGIESGEAIRGVAEVVAVVGWVMIARAFGPEIDWRGLRSGGVVVAAGLLLHYVGTVFQAIPIVDKPVPPDYRPYFILMAVSELVVFVAAAVVVSGLGDSLRGPRRAWRLRLGAIVAAGAFLLGTLSLPFLHD